MNKAFGFTSTTSYDEHDDERKVRTVRIRLTAADRKAARKDKRAFVKQLQECGIVREYGCRCTHCMNGWDCCGNFFTSSTQLVFIRRGVKAIQHFTRNI